MKLLDLVTNSLIKIITNKVKIVSAFQDMPIVVSSNV